MSVVFPSEGEGARGRSFQIGLCSFKIAELSSLSSSLLPFLSSLISSHPFPYTFQVLLRALIRIKQLLIGLLTLVVSLLEAILQCPRFSQPSLHHRRAASSSMTPNPLEEESQVLPEQFNVSNYQPLSDDDQHGPQIPGTQSNVEVLLVEDNLDQGPDSYASRIDETQFAPLEPDTQSFGQESLESRVLETQFANVEIDTQAMETQVSLASRDHPFSPETDRVLRPAITEKPNSPPSGNKDPTDAFITRPVARDISPDEEFTFAKAKKAKAGQYALPPPKRSKGAPKSQPPQESPVTHTVPKLQGQ